MSTKYEINLEHVSYYKALENIRASGVVNMWGSSPLLAREFPELDMYKANQILLEWIQNYSELVATGIIKRQE